MQPFDLDLAAAAPVNHLWGELMERLGLDRAARAVQQALDLQAMRGQPGTLPLLLVETCGVGLVDRVQLRAATGLPLPQGDALVLLFSRGRMELQLLEVQS